MATPTYTAIASITLGSSASSVTFSSIPQDYRDLVVVMDAQGSAAFVKMYFNSDTTDSNYPQVQMYGTGSQALSGTLNGFFITINPLDDKQNAITQIMDYSATDKHKTALCRGNNPSGNGVQAFAGRWSNTSAVTTVELEIQSGTFNTGSTFALYGIAS